MRFYTIFCGIFLVTTACASKDERIEAYDKFTKAINIVQNLYVEKVSVQDLVDKAIAGMMNNLDAHSDFLDEKSQKTTQQAIDGEFGGIGVTLDVRDGAIMIVSPLEGEPAQKAGIKSGDIIVEIDGKNVVNFTLQEAINLMRGKDKTPVSVKVYRKDEGGNRGEILKFDMKRAIIKTPSVYARKIMNEPFFYLRVTNFDKNVTKLVLEALKDVGKTPGIILDLRGNPGGLVNQAVSLSDIFISDGVIVTQKGKNPAENINYRATQKSPYENTPLVVLVDAGSASASEIVAGALQDHRRAVIIGEKTFGKGSVQVILPLNPKESLKITTSRYYLPSGRSIQNEGVEPDIIVHAGAVPTNKKAYVVKEERLKNHLNNLLADEKANEKSVKKPKDAAPDPKPNDNNELSADNVNGDLQLKTAIDTLKIWERLRPNKTK